MTHKIRKMGITGIQHVVVYQAIPNASTVGGSVSWGTVFKPLLFFILISDADANTNYSFVSFSVDDKRINMKISSAEDNKNYIQKSSFWYVTNNNMLFHRNA